MAHGAKVGPDTEFTRGNDMSHPCNPERYRYCATQERVISEVLQSISEFEQPPTRCQIEEAMPQLLHGAIAHALLDLVERGQIEANSDYFQGEGWLTVWVVK